MNQTRILLGVILLLLAAFGFLWWNQQSQLETQRKAHDELVATLAEKHSQPAASAEAAADSAAEADRVEAGKLQAKADMLAAKDAEYAALKKEVAAMRASNQADAEEKQKLAAKSAALAAKAGEVASLKEEVDALKSSSPALAASSSKDAEMAALREEMETLRAKGEADAEEKERLAGELERAKFEMDQRKQRILGAPMLCKVSKVLPQHGFIVIAAGRATGIEPGDAFSIRRGDKIICRITIGQSVEEGEAVADPVAGTLPPNEQILEGDDVVKLD